MPSTIATQAVVLCLALLSPALTRASSEPDFHAVKQALKQRDMTDVYHGLPPCDGDGNNPQDSTVPSQYQDNQGKSVSSGCQSNMDQMTVWRLSDGVQKSGYYHQEACYTDYVLVGYTLRYEKWKLFDQTYCPKSGTCNLGQSTQNQTCQTVGGSFSISLQETIKAGIPFIGEADISSTQTASIDTSTQWCTSLQMTKETEWDTPGCHALWMSNAIYTIYGYQRRLCNSPSGAANVNMKNQPRQPGSADPGWFTRGMRDFQFDIPGRPALDPDGPCGDFLESALPAGNATMVPWPVGSP